MDKVEARAFTRNLILVAILATIFSSFTLWLIDSWIKYPLFLFEILTIIILYLIVTGYDIQVTMKPIRIDYNFGLIIDIFLIVSALSLLLLNVLHVQGGLIQLILALFCTSLLPGYALLNISGLTRYFSKLEAVVLSYILSYIFTAVMTFGLLPINADMRTLLMLSVFIGMGLVSALKHRKGENVFSLGSYSRNIDVLALITALGFYALSFSLLYPGFASLPGTDISQHYGLSIVLWRTPELYTNLNYFLAHLHESAFITLSNTSVTSIQTTLLMLNFTIPLAFYTMAKSYLEKIDVRLPAISTIFYSAFSGFAWIYLAKLKLDGVGGSQLSLLSMVNDKAYNGAMYLAQPSLWYTPLSVSFTILIIQFMLLRKLDMSKRSFVALFSLLTVASFMTHVTEAVILSLFISFYAFFSRTKNVRIDDALLAFIISFICLDAFYPTLQYLLGKSLGFSILSLLVPTATLILVYVYRKLPIYDRLITSLSKLTIKHFIKGALYIVTFVYILGLITWVVGVSPFHTYAIVDVGSIPWFIYPVFLGALGVLTLASFYYLLQDVEAKKLVMPFIVIIAFSFVFGRILTFINVNFFDAGYWEKRFTGYFFLASAILAPIAVIKLIERVKANHNKITSTLFNVALISMVVIYGVQSSFVVLEYWSNISSALTSKPSEQELQAINYLSHVLDQDKYAYTITLTSGSVNTLTFAAPPYQLTGMQLISTAENPDMPLLSLKAHNLSHAYIYMHNRDFEVLNRNPQSWLAKHLIPMLPIIYRNSETTIYNASSVSFPQINSTTALVVPFDNSIDPNGRWLYAYDVLSLGEYNYTVAYDLDPGIFMHDTLVLSVDPPSESVLKKSFSDDFSTKMGWIPVSGTWRYTDNGLEVGKPGVYEDAIFLSPLSAQNFTESISFKPLDGDLKVANYVSLVYDWKDPQNYNYAGLMFDGNGKVYASFSFIKNGVVTVYPTWPGLDTGLKWRFGDSFNLTLSVQGDTVTLHVNGSQILSMKSPITGGKLGIRTTRFYKTLFTGFKADVSSSVELRSAKEYLDYVERGGRLIVLNTNGYGYFADRILTRGNSSMGVYEISGSGDVRLPENITISKLSPKAENVETIANYMSQQDSSVYAAKQKIGSGEIIYLNVYPILDAIEKSGNNSCFYNLLGKVLKPAYIPLKPFIFTPPELTATFKQVEMSGDVHVNASSVLFPLNLDFQKVQITHRDGSLTTLVNVTRLQMPDYGSIRIDASTLTLSGGRGFYSALNFKGKVIVTPKSDSASVIVLQSKENITQFSDVKMINIEDNDVITLYTHQPTIRVLGTAYFKELWSSAAIYQKTKTQGQDLMVKGEVKLTLYLSDNYSWASLFDASGSFERTPPIIVYDELSSLPQAAFWSLILIPIFLITVFAVERRELKQALNYA